MTLKVCLTCGARHSLDGPRCRGCYLAQQRIRNAKPERQALYGGAHRARSQAARRAQPWCSICGSSIRTSWDHEHGQVECQSCNSSHRRNPK